MLSGCFSPFLLGSDAFPCLVARCPLWCVACWDLFFFKLNHCSFFLVTACLVSFLLITSKYKPAISCVLNLLFRGFSFSLFDLYTKDLNFDIVEFINFVDENPVP